jgi:CheY-like chemotaxis protein
MQVIPQIVIADWQMPEMNGVALAGRCARSSGGAST